VDVCIVSLGKSDSLPRDESIKVAPTTISKFESTGKAATNKKPFISSVMSDTGIFIKVIKTIIFLTVMDDYYIKVGI
jgi:hypothetical protein